MKMNIQLIEDDTIDTIVNNKKSEHNQENNFPMP